MSNSRHGDADDRFIRVRSFGVTFQTVQIVPTHTDGWHKLMYATRGVVTVHAGNSAWVAPPHRGIWIPAGVPYRVEISGVVAMRALYLRMRVRELQGCAVVNVTPLLRELIVRIVHIGALDERIAHHRHLMALLLDELRVLSTIPLQLPQPRDPRTLRFIQAVEGTPKGRNAKVYRAAGASRRTLERLFQDETAMSLGQWLRRNTLVHALRRLAAGDAVQTVAYDLGYASPSAFIAMFRRELGQTPARYFEP